MISRYLAVLVLGGCASAIDTPAPLAVEVGGADAGGYGFVAWTAPSSNVPVITGSQGGQHIWVSVRSKLSNSIMFDTSVTMYREATGSDAEVLVKPGTVEIMRKTQALDSWQVVSGLPAFVKEPCKIREHRVRVEAQVRSGDGRLALAKAWIVPHFDGYCDP